jgi:hypothetical protein
VSPAAAKPVLALPARHRHAIAVVPADLTSDMPECRKIGA